MTPMPDALPALTLPDDAPPTPDDVAIARRVLDYLASRLRADRARVRAGDQLADGFFVNGLWATGDVSDLLEDLAENLPSASPEARALLSPNDTDR